MKPSRPRPNGRPGPNPLAGCRAGAALDLSGRYARFARQAADGLHAWAEAADVALTVIDSGDDPAAAAELTDALSGRCDVLFGPYGSGATRAVATRFAGRPEVIWNHGGAAAPATGARLVDVLAPAERYWHDLAAVLGRCGHDVGRVAILSADSPFARAVAAGAAASLGEAGRTPLQSTAFAAADADAAVRRARAAGAAVIIGCGRFEDDVALGRALAPHRDLAVGLVACGVRDAETAFGEAVVGWFGPCQWIDRPATRAPPELPPGVDYPAAQAFACGRLVEAAALEAGGLDHDRVWNAVRGLVTRTFLGDFAVDADGRQVAHRPTIVRWQMTERGPERVPA
jgi:ABC-type branched-subunit amino acid transport system substrate-binding protein